MLDLQLRSIHPFPARMAPEIALSEALDLPKYSLILDPMVGSGTVMRVASELGHTGIGFDMDPLAVLMARVWTTPIDTDALRKAGEKTADKAQKMHIDQVELSWADKETLDYINFWFAKEQQIELCKISALLTNNDSTINDALRVALSRLIITKNTGASLARDVSHSRPHRVRTTNDFRVIDEFRRSVIQVAKRLDKKPPCGNVSINVGDARHMSAVEAASVDAIITSPPYLNAIDYMRGHRLSLVWLGYKVSELRTIRQTSIGTERMLSLESDTKFAHDLRTALKPTAHLPCREQRIIERYALDMHYLINEFKRVLRPKGKSVLVIGNSCLKGVYVENSLLISAIAESIGFTVEQKRERELPPNRRYLPPPSITERSTIEKRMRTETILTLRKI